MQKNVNPVVAIVAVVVILVIVALGYFVMSRPSQGPAKRIDRPTTIPPQPFIPKATG